MAPRLIGTPPACQRTWGLVAVTLLCVSRVLELWRRKIPRRPKHRRGYPCRKIADAQQPAAALWDHDMRRTTYSDLCLLRLLPSGRRAGGPPRALHSVPKGRKSWMVPICLAVVWLSGLALSPLLAQKHITVRFLDPKSGKPIHKLRVWVYQYKGNLPKGPIPLRYELAHAKSLTDEKGEALVTLHDPPPKFIGVVASDLSNSGPVIPLCKVLKFGVVLDYSRKVNGSKPKTSAKPGEIVFVERKLTVWDRMRQELP